MAPPPPDHAPSMDASGSELSAALRGLHERLRQVAPDGVDAVSVALADWAGAERVGRGTPPAGAMHGDGLWWLNPRRPADHLSAAAMVATLAFDLAEAEARNHALLEASFEGLCLHEAGRIIEVNHALAQLYGYRRDEMMGMHVSTLAAPEVLPRIQRIVQSGYSGAYETVALTRSGHRVPLEARGKAAMWNGRPVRAAAFRDLRERKKVEAELVAAREAAEEASRTKTRFLANMSHELRTPMNGVLGMVDLLLSGPLSPDQRKRAEVIRSSSGHLMDLLNDILDVSQVEEGRLELRPEPVHLKPLLQSTVDTVRAAAEERALQLRIQMSPDIPGRWHLDPLRLRQVLVNLLGNAVRHTREGHVEVGVAEDPRGLRMWVTDTGEGMTADTRERLFERFAGTGARTGRGRSGLGLSISADLVQLMGGQLGVTSELGTGTTFSFQLTSHPTPHALDPNRRPRILLLDPDFDRRDHLVRILESRGAVAMALADGPDARAIVEAFAPDVLYVAAGTYIHGPGVTAVGPDVDAPPGTPRIHAPLLADDLLDIWHHRADTPECDGASYRRLEVLVVDDHPVNRLVAEQLVTRAGHAVQVVSDAASALDRCAHRTFDLVLMDVEMPSMTGIEATRILRGRGYSGRIVALTAHALADDTRSCRAAGMDDVLTKPVSVAQLLGVLRDAADSPAHYRDIHTAPTTPRPT